MPVMLRLRPAAVKRALEDLEESTRGPLKTGRMTDYARLGSRALEHIRHLAVDIGPRGSTTAAEKRGSDYAAQEMRRWAAEVQVEPFRCYSTFSLPWGLVALLQAASAVLLWFSPPAALIAAGVNLLLHFAVASGRADVGFLFPKRPSQNVWGRVPPGRVPSGCVSPAAPAAGGPGPSRRVVFLAHVDSTRATLAYAPKALKNLRASHVLNLVVTVALLVLPLLGLALVPFFGAALFAARVAVSVLALIALYALGNYVHRQLFMPYVAGANDNASGVGLALALGEHYAAEPLSDTEVWCVVTGCEETGYPAGARHFVDRHFDELRDADFIILDNLGAGELRHLTREGIVLPLRMDPGLLELARRIGRRHPEWNVRDSVCNLGYTDATPVLTAGCRALAVWAEGPDGFLVNYHWPTDTFENIDPETVTRAAQFVAELVEAINRGEGRDVDRTDGREASRAEGRKVGPARDRAEDREAAPTQGPSSPGGSR